MDQQSFAPNAAELRSRARADLGMGLPVVIRDGAALFLAAAAETLEAPRLAALAAAGRAELALTARRAATLKLAAYDGDLARIRVAPGTGPEALRAIIDPAADLARPLKGPFAPLRDGDAAPHRAALALVKSARLLPAALLAPVEAAPEGLTVLDLPTAAAPASFEGQIAAVISARLPIAAARQARLHLFRPDDGGEEHCVVEIGRPDRHTPVLARLHSACFTGDILGSLKCDCGPQLNGALGQMAAEGAGLLLYLNQEGRGIGLANKLRAYALQDQGFDTVEANHRLGFEDDERDFRIGAAMLRRMGFGAVRLLTNNPRKVGMLEAEGIEVPERVPLWVGATDENARYLATKAEKSGHLK